MTDKTLVEYWDFLWQNLPKVICDSDEELNGECHENSFEGGSLVVPPWSPVSVELVYDRINKKMIEYRDTVYFDEPGDDGDFLARLELDVDNMPWDFSERWQGKFEEYHKYPNLNPINQRWFKYDEQVKNLAFYKDVWTQVEALNIIRGYQASRQEKLLTDKQYQLRDHILGCSGGSLETLNSQDSPEHHRYKAKTFLKWMIKKGYRSQLPEILVSTFLGVEADRIGVERRPDVLSLKAEQNEGRRLSSAIKAAKFMISFPLLCNGARGFPTAEAVCYAMYDPVNTRKIKADGIPLHGESDLLKIIRPSIFKQIIRPLQAMQKIHEDLHIEAVEDEILENMPDDCICIPRYLRLKLLEVYARVKK